MLEEWVDLCLDLSSEPADFFSGARKILRNRSYTFTNIKDDLQVEDCGYTKSKITLLKNLYLHEESHEMAISLWERRVGQRKYGSVSFTCFNHLLKSDPNKKSKRASVMGPCLQSVVITYMNDHTAQVDVFYRTTELFKKFPADLIFLRDYLLKPFDFSKTPLTAVNFHFANITIHPMYFVTVIPHIENINRSLRQIGRKDKRLHLWIVKWTSRYFFDEYHRGIQKFAQAMRVHMDANNRIVGDQKDKLLPYLKEHHPGFSKEYQSP